MADADSPAAGTGSLLILRPATPVLDHGDGEVQVGTDPRWSLVLSGLADHEARWLRDVGARRHRSLDRSARHWGVNPDRREQIVRALADGGFLVRPAEDGGPDLPGGDTGWSSDSAVLGALRPDGAGAATLSRRGAQVVGLHGLGRIGAALAGLLADAGVGGLVLDDRDPVQVGDLGLGGYGPDDVGRPREQATAERLRHAHPRLRVGSELGVVGRGPTGLPDVVVVVESHAARPERYERLLGAAVPHLPVVVREADVVVGPLVLPGRSACVGCCDRHAADADRGWPFVVADLARRPLADVAHETTLAATSAALAAGQVLAQLDGARPTTVGRRLEVALPEAVPRVRDVAPHPGCGCTRLPA
ncbi:ThiF family adenylyltransferase [Krasilnikoviella flava]|uniref:ThiF family protein n=1 Tax=Krasilnikoviella flava TaxID=526729 RepID=A0A1T5JIC9_9MICO|nr:ThiF family adenylyltransferase [Krasilnikoviella flava]SKC51145.1 ThiF family protein [Krasilnikoviella flava]